MAVFGTRQEGEHIGFLTHAEGIARSVPRSTPPVVDVRLAFPALDGSRRDADHLTSGVESGSDQLGLVQGGQDHGSGSSSVSTSSSASRAWSFF
jgi:hypothetical protein